jgi:hypothetical protein
MTAVKGYSGGKWCYLISVSILSNFSCEIICIHEESEFSFYVSDVAISILFLPSSLVRNYNCVGENV